MGFFWTDFSNLANDVKVDITQASVNNWLQEIGSSYYPYTEGSEDFPYQLEWEFSESVIIQTYKHSDAQYLINPEGRYESETIRTVAFGSFTYTAEGVLETASFSSWYSMALTKGEEEDGLILADRLWGTSNIYDGLRITDVNNVAQLDVIERFFDDSSSHDPYENNAFDSEEGPASDKGLGKAGILSSEAGKYFYDQWYVNPFGNNLITTTLTGGYLDYSSYSPDGSRRYSVSIASGGSFVLDGDSNTFGKSTTTTAVSADYSYIGTAGNDRLLGSQGANGQSWAHDFFDAGEGDDFIGGGGGRDVMKAGLGNDELRGGYGHDVLDGGAGEDILYGGGGRNTFNNNDDGDFDQLFVLSDYHAHNYEWGRLHKGANADTINSLGEEDRITILGVETDELSIRQLNDGLGIFASGSLEAVVTDSSWNVSSLGSNVFGDASRFW